MVMFMMALGLFCAQQQPQQVVMKYEAQKAIVTELVVQVSHSAAGGGITGVHFETNGMENSIRVWGPAMACDQFVKLLEAMDR
jgi:hypothetical protein